MPFQSTIRYDLGFGVVGEIRLDSPVRSRMGLINTATAANNVIGRVFTQNPTTGAWSAGNVPTTNVNPAILATPKAYASVGGATGPLSPTLTLNNQTEGEFIDFGFVVVALLTTTTPSIGDQLHFQQADGQIIAVTPGTAVAGGNQLLPNANVVLFPQPNANGLALIRLTN